MLICIKYSLLLISNVVCDIMFICDKNKAGFLFTKMRFFHYKFSVSLSKLKRTKDR